MKTSLVIAAIGSLLAMIFAFANLGMYMIWAPNHDWVLFILLMLIAAAVGAVPGLIIGLVSGKGQGNQEKPPA